MDRHGARLRTRSEGRRPGPPPSPASAQSTPQLAPGLGRTPERRPRTGRGRDEQGVAATKRSPGVRPQGLTHNLTIQRISLLPVRKSVVLALFLTGRSDLARRVRKCASCRRERTRRSARVRIARTSRPAGASSACGQRARSRAAVAAAPDGERARRVSAGRTGGRRDQPTGERGRRSGPGGARPTPAGGCARCAADGDGGAGGTPHDRWSRPRSRRREGPRLPRARRADDVRMNGTCVRESRSGHGRTARCRARASGGPGGTGDGAGGRTSGRGRGRRDGAPDGAYRCAQISSFVPIRSTTASVNSVVPAWPPRSGVLQPAATVSSVAS